MVSVINQRKDIKMKDEKETQNDFDPTVLAMMLSIIGQPKPDLAKRIDYLEAKVDMLEKFVVANVK